MKIILLKITENNLKKETSVVKFTDNLCSSEILMKNK